MTARDIALARAVIGVVKMHMPCHMCIAGTFDQITPQKLRVQSSLLSIFRYTIPRTFYRVVHPATSIYSLEGRLVTTLK